LCTLVGRIPGILKRIKPGGARVAGRDDDTPRPHLHLGDALRPL